MSRNICRRFKYYLESLLMCCAPFLLLLLTLPLKASEEK